MTQERFETLREWTIVYSLVGVGFAALTSLGFFSGELQSVLQEVGLTLWEAIVGEIIGGVLAGVVVGGLVPIGTPLSFLRSLSIGALAGLPYGLLMGGFSALADHGFAGMLVAGMIGGFMGFSAGIGQWSMERLEGRGVEGGSPPA